MILKKRVHFGILIHVLSWRQKRHKCLLWLLRISDTFFDVLFDDQYLTPYKTPANMHTVDISITTYQPHFVNVVKERPKAWLDQREWNSICLSTSYLISQFQFFASKVFFSYSSKPCFKKIYIYWENSKHFSTVWLDQREWNSICQSSKYKVHTFFWIKFQFLAKRFFAWSFFIIYQIENPWSKTNM